MMRKQVYDKFFSDNALLYIEDVVAHFDGTKAGVQKIEKKTIEAWLDQFILSGSYRLPSAQERKRQRKNKRRSDAMPQIVVDAIRGCVDGEPRMYLDEIREWLFDNHFYSTRSSTRRWAPSTIYHALVNRIGYSLTRLRRLAVQADINDRLRFRAAIASVDPECLIFCDESHVSRDDVRRRRGWSTRGQSTDVFEHFGQGDVSYTLFGAFNIDGFVFDACMAGRGINNSERFAEWVEHRLCPVLGSWVLNEPNSVVVLDNASIHHKLFTRISRLIRAAGARIVFLSPFSPCLNPIEEAFHQFKCYIRTNWRAAAVDHDVVLDNALRSVSRANALGYFRHAGINVARIVAADAAAVANAAAESDFSEELATAAVFVVQFLVAEGML